MGRGTIWWRSCAGHMGLGPEQWPQREEQGREAGEQLDRGKWCYRHGCAPLLAAGTYQRRRRAWKASISRRCAVTIGEKCMGGVPEPGREEGQDQIARHSKGWIVTRDSGICRTGCKKRMAFKAAAMV